MIYVVGSGRCGTATLARKLGGLHEPEPTIIAEATDYYLGKRSCLPELCRKLRARAQLPTPAISDPKQSTVIPLIVELDPSAELIVLVREPTASIASMAARGAYQRPNWIWDQHRLRPRTGFPADWSPIMKLGWLWVETYRVIFSSLDSRAYRLMFTSDLGKLVLNASETRPCLTASPAEQQFLDDHITPFWQEIQTLATQHSPSHDHR